MTYLITGISGFVGGHYVEYLLAEDAHVRIAGIDTRECKLDFLDRSSRKNIDFFYGSLLDRKWFWGVLEKVKPDYIVNLAAHSSVAFSWERPVECFTNNTGIFLNIIEWVRKAQIKTRILAVGSAEIYGVIKKRDILIDEGFPLEPANPYAVGRLAQEHLSKIYSTAYQISIVNTRSFNHIGPRQSDTFVVSSLAKQVIELKKGRRDKIICGNLDVVRDFMDVRDVVRAYDLLLKKGKVAEVYNVCSGEGHKLSEVLEILKRKKGLKSIPLKEDPHLIRPVDNIAIIGSCKKLCKDTGFKRRYTLSRSLEDILAYWDSCIS